MAMIEKHVERARGRERLDRQDVQVDAVAHIERVTGGSELHKC